MFVESFLRIACLPGCAEEMKKTLQPLIDREEINALGDEPITISRHEFNVFATLALASFQLLGVD